MYKTASILFIATVASLNADGKTQLAARMRMMPPYGSWKGFSGAEVQNPRGLALGTLKALPRMMTSILYGLVSDDFVKKWRLLAETCMRVGG